MRQRYYYICNVFADSVKSERDITSDSPAATAKVSRLCRAVRLAGGGACIISLGRGLVKNSWRRHAGRVGRINGVPAVYLPFLDVPLLSHIVTFVALCAAVLRLGPKKSVLVFYNPQIHYLGAVVLGRLLGRRCILDLEDGYRADLRNMASRLYRALLVVFDRLCNSGVMLACSKLEGQVRTRPTFVCYGVAEPVAAQREWTGEPVKVLFGGSLYEDTGAGLFLESLEMLKRDFPAEFLKLEFLVTGSGDYADAFRRSAQGELGQVLHFHGSVGDREYREILQQAHVGLCLKLPSRSMGETTFPSKVVELSSQGLLLITTRVSDVPLLFDETSASLLAEATPRALVLALVSIVHNRNTAGAVALSGQKRIASLLSARTVGPEVLHFWQGEPSRDRSGGRARTRRE